MNQKAVTAAEEKLQSTYESYRAVKRAKTRRELHKAWFEFLMHSNGIFSKLEQGAKTGSSYGWFGKVKQRRKNDPLLIYLHHARNAAEHGDTILDNDDVVVGRPAHTTVLFAPGAFNPETGEPTGPPVAVMPMPARFGLKTVMDKGVAYSPPISHPSEAQFASAVLDYLAKLIEEAKARIEKG